MKFSSQLFAAPPTKFSFHDQLFLSHSIYSRPSPFWSHERNRPISVMPPRQESGRQYVKMVDLDPWIITDSSVAALHKEDKFPYVDLGKLLQEAASGQSSLIYSL